MTGGTSVGALDRLRHARSRATLAAPSEGRDASPTVTVVVPCYNYGRFLPAAVASVTSQERVAVEVIVVDDASTDGSAEVAAGLAAGDPRVRLIAHEHNKGHIATYNDGLAAATGEYSVLLSADDLLAPGALGRATALMEARPSVGLVYGTAEPFDEMPPAAVTDVRAWSTWRGEDWVTLLCDRVKNTIRSPEVVVRTSIQRSAGGYRPDLPHSGDMEMWLRVASLADIGRVVGPHQAYYRIHGLNMHSEQFGGATGAGILIDLRSRLQVFEAWQEWMTARGIPSDALVERARRALAREALVLGCRAYWWGLVGDWPVEGLREFAVETYPGARGLAQWAVLDRHVRVGPRQPRRYPPYVVRSQLDKVERRTRLAREQWTGV
ncbi:MAG: glycosyltransferase family 2 protein [Cellulomonas sp.]